MIFQRFVYGAQGSTPYNALYASLIAPVSQGLYPPFLLFSWLFERALLFLLGANSEALVIYSNLPYKKEHIVAYDLRLFHLGIIQIQRL